MEEKKKGEAEGEEVIEKKEHVGCHGSSPDPHTYYVLTEKNKTTK